MQTNTAPGITRLRRPPALLSMMLVAMLPVAGARAKNVDLVTLPRRDTVQLTIYNSEDLTLAKETRFVTLKKGDNRLQFSWAGTLIDPTSVELRPLAHAESIDVVDTMYPGQKPQHLIWRIRSEVEGQVPVEVRYFTSGLTWQMDYVAITNADETKLDFQGHVRVFNSSGEEYENAEIRLIVGKINLVEKIRDLAAQRGIQPGQPVTGAMLGDLRKEAVTLSLDALSFQRTPSAEQPAQVIKEGLSEYFMFRVEGQQTIPNGWSKRMQALAAAAVDFEIVYRQRAHQYGPRPVRFFVWSNDQEHRLGESPLPDGLVRVFRQNGQDGLSYLGQQSLNYVPVQADIEVNLGPDDLVVYQRRRLGTRRFEFSFHPHSKQVTGWAERQEWVDTLRNYRDKPIRLELQLRIDGDAEFTPQGDARSFDFNTVETELTAQPLNSAEFRYAVTTHQGANAKQNRVRLIFPQ